jgi:dihydroorotate dehydrogenase
VNFYQWVRPLLFSLDPERAHALSLIVAEHLGFCAPLLRRLFTYAAPALQVEAMGLRFPNPLGLAAGYDKNGRAARSLLALGFGHVELGTFTPHAQVGNPRPRVHRLPAEQAVINALGFPNEGIDAFATRSKRSRAQGIVGVNIGKAKATPIERAAEDYALLVGKALLLGDYVTVNISSPNTADLRELQTEAYFAQLLSSIASARAVAPAVPVLIKIAPDLKGDELDALVDCAISFGMNGVVATNTTLDRTGVPERYRTITGGLSGAPLRERSLGVVTRVAKRASGRLTVVGAGGVDSAAAVRHMLDAGALLVQLYTALIFEGPALPGRICAELHAARTRLAD